MSKSGTLIFDGDDTLWKTHFLYRRIKFQAASLLNSAGVAVSRGEFARKVDEISVAFGSRFGFTSERFPTALVEAYEYFCTSRRTKSDAETQETIWNLGVSVATMKPIVMPYARKVLKKLSTDYECILYTLGNEKEQRFRIDAASLNEYFKDVFIVLNKNESALKKILSGLNLEPNSVWMIGNSAKSDIEPALNQGLNCIWLHSEHWLLDEVDLDVSQIHEVKSLKEIPPIIETWTLRRKKHG